MKIKLFAHVQPTWKNPSHPSRLQWCAVRFTKPHARMDFARSAGKTTWLILPIHPSRARIVAANGRNRQPRRFNCVCCFG